MIDTVRCVIVVRVFCLFYSLVVLVGRHAGSSSLVAVYQQQSLKSDMAGVGYILMTTKVIRVIHPNHRYVEEDGLKRPVEVAATADFTPEIECQGLLLACLQIWAVPVVCRL